MVQSLSSRERVLRAIDGEEPDYVPCCFMIFTALESRCSSHYEFVEKQLELGLDAMVQVPARPLRATSDHADLPGLPVRFDPSVELREWREEKPGERYPTLRKEYLTPVGTLSTEVSKTDDWPYGGHVPFLDDYLIPRSRTFLVSKEQDLAPLCYLLAPPTTEDIQAFRMASREAKEFAAQYGVLLWAGWGAVGDMAGWLCGLRNLIYLSADDPTLVKGLLDMLAAWNRVRMEVMLESGVDLFIRRGWYEGSAFWSPYLYREFLLPSLRADADLVHERRARFGYIMTTGSMPLMEMFLEAGVDVLIGVDPVQGRDTDLAVMKEKAAGKMALWGGVNGFLTVERGTSEEIEKAVTEAIRLLAPGGGFILSPVDNVRDTSPTVWKNVLTFTEAWKRAR